VRADSGARERALIFYIGAGAVLVIVLHLSYEKVTKTYRHTIFLAVKALRCGDLMVNGSWCATKKKKSLGSFLLFNEIIWCMAERRKAGGGESFGFRKVHGPTVQKIYLTTTTLQNEESNPTFMAYYPIILNIGVF
jgi:hypothetical protein